MKRILIIGFGILVGFILIKTLPLMSLFGGVLSLSTISLILENRDTILMFLFGAIGLYIFYSIMVHLKSKKDNIEMKVDPKINKEKIIKKFLNDEIAPAGHSIEEWEKRTVEEKLEFLKKFRKDLFE